MCFGQSAHAVSVTINMLSAVQGERNAFRSVFTGVSLCIHWCFGQPAFMQIRLFSVFQRFLRLRATVSAKMTCLKHRKKIRIEWYTNYTARTRERREISK